MAPSCGSPTADADTLVVYAKTRPDAGPRGITAFLVEKGFRRVPRRRKNSTSWACAARRHSELVFEDCEVPEENVLGAVEGGVRVLMSGLDYERAVLAAGPLGIMQACLDVVHALCARAQAVRPADRRVPADAGQDRRHVYDAECLPGLCLCRGARLRPRPDDAQGCRRRHPLCGREGNRMALEAIQALGGNGYINDFPTGRLLRDAKLYEIGAGTSEIRRMLIGREMFQETM